MSGLVGVAATRSDVRCRAVPCSSVQRRKPVVIGPRVLCRPELWDHRIWLVCRHSENLAEDQYQQPRRTGKRGDSTNVAVQPCLQARRPSDAD